MNNMPKLYYDFHIHSCLSPCADNDMTPNNIVNMAKLKGLDAIALTDHNSCQNCKATIIAGQRAGIIVLPGMELCTNEDIHVICLFETLENAIAFSEIIYIKIPQIKNRADIYGEQLICDEDDNITGTEEFLLINAADISVIDVLKLAQKYGGVAFPAHIDKISNGIISILGGIPPEAGFKTVEISDNCDKADFIKKYTYINIFDFLKNSDAHYLWQISERKNFIELPEICDSKNVYSTISIINQLNW